MYKCALAILLVFYSLHSNAQSILTGDNGYSSTTLPAPAGETFEAATASWQVHIGGDGSLNCNSGTFPVLMRWHSDQTFLRGLIYGDIPNEVDMYGRLCSSSAAILIRDNANNSTVSETRIDGAYDAIRATSSTAGNFSIKSSWISNNRARCLQNLSGTRGSISDSLFEGCSTGINMGSTDPEGINNQLTIDQLLLQVKAYNISTGFESGNLFTGNGNATTLTINNSTLAYNDPDIFQGIASVLDFIGEDSTKLAGCNANQLLWMANDNSPEALDDISPCFELITGLQAQKKWEQERCRWINDHASIDSIPAAERQVRRLPGDPVDCDENTLDGLVILPEGDYMDDDVFNAEGIQFRKFESDIVYDASRTRFFLNNCTVDDPENYPGILNDPDRNERNEVGCAIFANDPLAENRNPLSRYPLVLEGVNTTIVKPLIDGQVPQNFNFQLSYFNSAAILLNNNASNSKVYGARINNAWDGIRVNNDNFIISDVYSTNTRDDCIENDGYNSGKIIDSLFDNCSVGLSIRNPQATVNVEDTELVVMDRVLMRLTSHKTSDNIFDIVDSAREGSLHAFKAKATSPGIEVHNSIFAYDTKNILGANQLSTMLGTADNPSSKLKGCSNNKILWLENDAPPSEFDNLPLCFELVTGIQARNTWEQARCEWINNHPASNVRRFDNETDECALPQIDSLAASATTILWGETVTLSTTVSDPDGEEFNDEDILWFSSIDGELIELDGTVAQGLNISTEALSVGIHDIRVQATDVTGAKGHQQITTTVQAPPASLSLNTDMPSPITAGNLLLLTADISGDNPSQYSYKFEIKQGDATSWTELQGFSSSSNYSWDSTAFSGKNRIRAVAQHISDNTIKYQSKQTLWVNQPSPVTQLQLVPSQTVILTSDETITLIANATSDTIGPYEYRFEAKNVMTKTVTALQDYGTINNYLWQPHTFLGKHRITVYARRANTEDQPVKQSVIVWINNPDAVQNAELTTLTNSPATAGALISLSAQGLDGTGNYEYAFQYRSIENDSQWQTIQGFSQNNSATWDTNSLLGNYRLRVRVKNAGSTDRPISEHIRLFKIQ